MELCFNVRTFLRETLNKSSVAEQRIFCPQTAV